MSYTIAVAGKGGTGKTTVAALIVHCLLGLNKKPILAIDADPNSNLCESLGVKCDRTVVGTVDELTEKQNDLPAGLTKERFLELHFQDALVEAKGFDLLVMGHTEGPGCYCHANNMLRNFIDKLQDNYAYIVMDNEAGMEHLSRRTTRHADVLLILANPNPVSLKSADRIFRMTKEIKLGIRKSYLVINEITSVQSPRIEVAEIEGLPVLSRLPYDLEIAEKSASGDNLLGLKSDSPALAEVKKMLGKLGIV